MAWPSRSKILKSLTQEMMMTKNTKTTPDGLFEADRRASDRAEASDRRHFLRPTQKLILRGALIALAVGLIIIGVVFLSKA